VSAADSEQIITPRANSFSAPQATVAISFATVEDGEAADSNGEPPRLTGLGTAADAALALARTQLSGNDYYTVANLLGTLRQLPGAPLEGGDAATPPGDFNGLLAVLRQEAGKLSGAAQDQATQLIGSLEGLLAPVPEQAAEAVQAETATSEAPPAEPAAPLTGFDKLADASWRRVEEVTQAERAQAQSLNGSAPPRAQAAPTAMPEPTATPVESAQPETAPQQPQPATPAAPPPVQPEQAATPQQATTPAPVEPKPTPAGAPPIRPAQAATPAAAEPMAEDMGEALNDGGSERRSSEPCYAGEFDDKLSATAADHQPASEKTEQAAEAAGETALSAEAETLSGADAAATSNAEAAADEMAAAAVAEELKSIAEAAAEIVAEQAESVSTPFPATGTAEAPSEGAPAASIADAGTTLASQAVAEATAAEQPASEPPPADQTASTAPVGVQSEAVASAERADAQSAAAEQTEPPLEKAAEKSARGGFFNRLFGSGSSKHQ
jgi:hypothetical protein